MLGTLWEFVTLAPSQELIQSVLLSSLSNFRSHKSFDHFKSRSTKLHSFAFLRRIYPSDLAVAP